MELHKRLAKLHIRRAIATKTTTDKGREIFEKELKLATFHCNQANLDIVDLMEEI